MFAYFYLNQIFLSHSSRPPFQIGHRFQPVPGTLHPHPVTIAVLGAVSMGTPPVQVGPVAALAVA